MVHCGLQVYDRHIGILRKRVENRVAPLLFPVLEGGKCPNSQACAVPSEHTYELRDVFRFVTVHHDSVTMLERPARPTRLEHDRVSAKLSDPDLHRGPGSQRW